MINREKPVPPEDERFRFGLNETQFNLISLAWIVFVFIGYCFTIYHERGDRIAAILRRIF